MLYYDNKKKIRNKKAMQIQSMRQREKENVCITGVIGAYIDMRKSASSKLTLH